MITMDRLSTDTKKQIERIQQMERHLNTATAAIEELTAALDRYEKAQEDFKALSSYYGSTDWNKDYDDDQAGRLPQDLCRGVLSEDAVWNLLEDQRLLQQRLRTTE